MNGFFVNVQLGSLAVEPLDRAFSENRRGKGRRRNKEG
jgi:hypothetical protein